MSLTLGSGAGKMCSKGRGPVAGAFSSVLVGEVERLTVEDEAVAWLSEAAWERRLPIMNPDARPKMEERVPVVVDAREWVGLRELVSEGMVEEGRWGELEADR